MHGCTFGGGPIAATAGGWTLAQIDRPAFLARVRRNGRALAAGLEALVARHPSLALARGLGLLRAVETLNFYGREYDHPGWTALKP